MSGDGFSADWLALREPADHAARNVKVARAVQEYFVVRDQIRVTDLGCGAGSNIRGTITFLPQHQIWTLVDYDPRLLAAARERLADWADGLEGDRLIKQGKVLEVGYCQHDLSSTAGQALTDGVDLVTAAALFDLCSREWLERFADTLAARRLPLYTVLTYDGNDRFDPPHPLDSAMLAAFHDDMRRNKGFGPAAGPDAANILQHELSARGYQVVTGDSPWVLDATSPLAAELAQGFTAAVIGTGRVDPEAARSWLQTRRAGGVWETGHTDLFAWLP